MICLKRKSPNPHLNEIHSVMRDLQEEDWTTAPRSVKRMGQLMSRLEKERDYAKESGYQEDYVALKQYIVSQSSGSVIIRKKGDLSEFNREHFTDNLMLAEVEIAGGEPDIATMDRLVSNMDAHISTMLIKTGLSEKGTLQMVPVRDTMGLVRRAIDVYDEYLKYLNTIEYTYPCLQNSNTHTAFYLDICSLSDSCGPVSSVKDNLNILALRSLKVNPFQSEAWRAFDLTYEESQRTNTADEE